MPTPRNGHHPRFRDPNHRLRIDNLTSIMIGGTAGSKSGGPAVSGNVLPRGHSGRLFVIAAGITVVLLWGTLYLIFRDWRAKYRVRTSYGVTRMATAIDPLAEIAPPAVEPVAWHDAVRQTHAMLVTVASSNLLDVADMRQLREELDRAVERARARPETAPAELAAIWDTLSDRAEFLFKDSRSASGDRHPRPKILPPRPAKVPASS